MIDSRHRDVQVILVPVPVGGSNEPIRQVKPGKYPLQRREAWRPQRAIPTRGARSVSLLRQIARQDQIVSEFMRPQPPSSPR
jgi:hypothetical protein